MSYRTIHVLVVDDEPAPCRELKRAFEVAETRDYAFVVRSVESAEEYHRAVSDREYDVLVVDIRLIGDEDEEGIDNVIAFHMRRWPETIVVVYSAFAELDPVPTCVRVMRLGAADCIAKSADQSVVQVVGSVIRELNERQRPERGPTSEWLEEHFDEICARYGGRAVAFEGDEIIFAADSVRELRDLLIEKRYEGAPYIMAIPSGEIDE